uniref:Uncharacterized protein n=1 Tax=Nelumbo nucifera TaxID=4432 RepID=A0A823A2T4_NELNU|nr:TPA_asm: hypothetical protein HUJ06_018335 [Nelumbo nucifera]
MSGVVGFLKDPAGAKPTTKVLLALCLAECNGNVVMEAGAVAEVVELEGSATKAGAVVEVVETVAELEESAVEAGVVIEVVKTMAELEGSTTEM